MAEMTSSGLGLILMVLWFLFWPVFAGFIAKHHNRNVLGWAALGIILGFLAIILLLVLPCLCPLCEAPLNKYEKDDGVCDRCRKTMRPQDLSRYYKC